jgi:CPA1 family monovalent cation:H+ antiporter
VQGFSLAPLIRAFRFAPEAGHDAEELLARRETSRRAAEALEDLARTPGIDPRDVEWLRTELREHHREMAHVGGSAAGRRHLRLEMLAAKRRMLVRLRNEDAISDEVLRTLEQELDLEAIRVGGGEER